MRSFWRGGLIAVAALAGAALYVSRPGHTPPGQAPLVELNAATLPEMQSDFNGIDAGWRVVLLLSPT